MISFLTQKLIDSETSNKEIFDSGEDNLPENIDIFDIEMERDLGLRSTLKDTDNQYRMSEGATWTKALRLWIKFQNAAELYDYARNGNISEVYGLGQIPILMNKKVPDNVIGWEFHSFFNGHDQFAYTHDNSQIQVAPMFANATISKISFMDSFTPISISKQFGALTSVLFSKIDDDQLKDGYAATMNEKGHLFFYIRRNFKQYSLFVKDVYAEQLAEELASGGDFNAVNFNPVNFNTDREYVSNLICSITKTNDHWWVYDKSNHNIKYMMNGEDVFTTADSWVVDPILDVPFLDGAYNTDGTDRTVINDIASGNNNGTLNNLSYGQWLTDNSYFSFGSTVLASNSGGFITFPTISALNSANEYTVALMFKPDSIINTRSFSEYLISKNYAEATGSFVIYRVANSAHIIVEWSNGTDFIGVYCPNAIKSTEWHSIVAKFKANQVVECSINGTNYVGVDVLPSNITTAGTLEALGSYAAVRGQIAYVKVWTTKIGIADEQRFHDEGYHNPVFPKAEKPQPVPDPTPPPIVRPFVAFYNLASDLTDANTVWLNSVQGDAPFNKFYDVAEGVDEADPELLKYDVPDGVTTGGGFVEYNLLYSCTDPSNNSSSEMSDTNDNQATVIEVQAGSGLIGKKITKAIFYLRGGNSPTGTVRCKVWNAAGTLVQNLWYNGTLNATLDAATVNTSVHTAYTFINTDLTPYGANSLAVGWKVGLEYNNGASGDQILVKRNRANPRPNEWNNNYDGTAWDDSDNPDDDDLVGELYEGGTGSATVDPWIEIGSGSPTTVTENFGATAHNLLNLKPTKIVLRLKKTGTPTGTFTVAIMNAGGSSVSQFTGTLTANSLTTSFADYTYVNLANTVAITNGMQISVNYAGTGGKICVMTNLGNTTAANATNTGGTNNYHGATSYARRYQSPSWTNLTAQDVSMKVYTGGGSFDAELEFTPTLTRFYEKCMTTDSSLYHRAFTKCVFRLRKVGTPTGLITCQVRKPDDGTRFSLGTIDSASLTTSFTDAVFLNVFNTTNVELNDKISLEYNGATVSNYVEVSINKDVFETTKTISGSYTSPVSTDNAQIDLAGQFYTGGEPDTASRTRVAQKVMTNDSIIDGEKLTKVLVWLRNPNSATGNIHCIVYRGSDDQLMVTIDTIAASGVSTGWASYEFENTTNGYVIDQNDKVAIVFEGGDSTHRLGVNVRAGTNYDAANSHVVRYNGLTYDDYLDATVDLVATMWRGGDTYQPPPNAIPDPTPTNNKDLLFCAGNNLLAGFARLLMREFRLYAEDTTEAEAINVYENRYTKTSRSANEVLLSGIYKPF
jgi:hypothetical protein